MEYIKGYDAAQRAYDNQSDDRPERDEVPEECPECGCKLRDISTGRYGLHLVCDNEDIDCGWEYETPDPADDVDEDDLGSRHRLFRR